MQRKLEGWWEAARIYRHPRVIVMLFLGFSAGLPYLLVFSTLSAWLRDFGVSRTAIGFFSWVGITYSIKVLWAPVVDRLRLGWLTARMGQRRSWMLLAQVGIASGLLALASLDPQSQLVLIAVAALVVAFGSATQDITIDAYRIEAVAESLQAAMAATYILGYRVALLMAGAGAFYVADFASWAAAYVIMAALMGVGMITVMVIVEPEHIRDPGAVEMERRISAFMQRHAHLPDGLRRLVAWFSGAVISPFVEFFRRNGLLAIAILLFVAVFRISDITMGVMANPFYLDLGFSKSEIASVTKVFGFFMTILGSAVGGLLVVRFGIMRPLLLAAVLVACTNLMFAGLAAIGADLRLLAVTISADNLSGGLANVAFIAYLSSLTNKAYTATQYALFSSLMTLPGKIIGGFSGVIVDASGYVFFFVYAAAVGVPGILLILFLMRHSRASGLVAKGAAGGLARIFHEGFGIQGKAGTAAWTIGRRGIARSMSQDRSSEMQSQIFPETE